MGANFLASALFLSTVTISTAQSLTVPSTLPGTWTSQGCYTEIDRTLNGGGYTDSANMTIETCIMFCSDGGFTYAGTEYSDQCYCDYTIATSATNVSTTDCSMPCVGNATERCGGPNRLNLFWDGAPPPQVNSGSGLWSYIGCYTEGKTGRILPNEVSTNGGVANMTIDLCLSACLTAGYNLAGAEYGQECWCGNIFSNGGAIAADGGCTILCANNKTEYCGGENRLNVYNFNKTLNSTIQTGTSSAGAISATPEPPAIVPSIGPYKYYGCQTEATAARALSSNSTSTDLMTLEYCAAWCVGYNLFGTEYGQECYCGNSFSAGSVPAPASDCSFTCSANSSEFCGASDRLSVYALNGTRATLPPPPTPLVLPSGWTYEGCWVDGVHGRILSYQFPDNATNTVESCISNCLSQNQNYTIAGVEFGVQCFCGTLIQNSGTNGTQADCNLACPGNYDEVCGAGDRLSVYSIGTPEVLPGPAVQILDLPRN